MKVKMIRLGLLSALLSLASLRAEAQDMSFDVDETSGGQKKTRAKTPSRPSKPSAPAPSPAPAPGDSTSSTEGDVISELAGGEQAALGKGKRSDASKKKTAKEKIYAVQQIYALRQNRLEINPSIGFTLNDPFIGHPSANLALNYWWTNVLAVGLNFMWYQALENESDLNFFVRRSTRLALPINEFQMGLNLNFTYVPLYGKFSMFNEYIFQWDAYVVGGVGTMRTRPIPIIDPEVRQFDYDWRLAFNVGIGLRVFLTRYLAIVAEIRDYAFLERYENTSVALGAGRTDKETWLDDSPSLTNNITAHIGASLFIPFSFDYKRPR